jgi:nitrogen fixation protein NifU and related proteins
MTAWKLEMSAYTARATILAMYSPQLLDHFEHPRNPGEIANPDVSAQVVNPACGDVLKLTLKLVDDRIADVRFLAKGCVPAMACGSAITELVKGKSIAEARKLQPGNVVDTLGGLPEASSHASHLAIDALRAALKKIKI